MNEDTSKVVSVEMLPDLSLVVEYSDGTKEYTKSIFGEDTTRPDGSSNNK